MQMATPQKEKIKQVLNSKKKKKKKEQKERRKLPFFLIFIFFPSCHLPVSSLLLFFLYVNLTFLKLNVTKV